MGIQRPAASGDGDRIDMKANLGRFLLIWPIAKEDAIPTSFGDREAIRANVVVLDDPAGPTRYDDVLLFGLGLIGQLKGAIGAAFTDPVAGRLVQGTAKAGQSPPWLIDDDWTAADEAAANKWIAENPVGRLQKTTQSPPAPPAPAAVIPAPPPPPVAPAVPVLSPPELISYMAVGWTDEQLTALPGCPALPALAAIRNQGKATGQLT